MSADPFVLTLQEWFEISRRSSMQDFLHLARENGLSMSQLGTMLHIHRIGSCGVTEIGEHLGVTSAAASQMLERLVQQGLVMREEHPEDRRVKRIELAEKGHQILENVMRSRHVWLENLASTLSESEKRQITADIRLLIEKAAQISTDPLSRG